MKKTTVIYHSADFDGIFCREIARKFLPEARLIGWNFGDTLLAPSGEPIYILDLSPDCLQPEESLSWARIIWIDHHATSIAKWGNNIPGYRIDGVAACRLAWQWFTLVDGNTPRSLRAGGSGPISPAGVLPMIHDYKTRQVEEPLAVRLVGEYDIWDKRDPLAETLQYGLRSRDLSDADWDDLLSIKVHSVVSSLLDAGEIAQCYAQKTDADLVTHRSYRLKWEGLDFLVLNTGRFNSQTFAALDKPETGHDALMGYMFNGKVWTVSLYHATHRTDIDLSLIAVKHGGGGHKGACGFTCKTLPF